MKDRTCKLCNGAGRRGKPLSACPRCKGSGLEQRQEARLNDIVRTDLEESLMSMRLQAEGLEDKVREAENTWSKEVNRLAELRERIGAFEEALELEVAR